jgi:hypothetical protein
MLMQNSSTPHVAKADNTENSNNNRKTLHFSQLAKSFDFNSSNDSDM